MPKMHLRFAKTLSLSRDYYFGSKQWKGMDKYHISVKKNDEIM